MDPSDVDYKAEVLKARSRELLHEKYEQQQSNPSQSRLDRLTKSINSIELKRHSFISLSVLSIFLLIIGLLLSVGGIVGMTSSFFPAPHVVYKNYDAPQLSGGVQSPTPTTQVASQVEDFFSTIGNFVASAFSFLIGLVLIVSSETIRLMITLAENGDNQAIISQAIFQALILLEAEQEERTKG